MSGRAQRGVALLPCLAVLALYAVAHQQGWVAVPCAAWGLWATWQKSPLSYRRTVFLIAGGLAVTVGLAGSLLVPTAPGMVPPLLLGPLGTGLAVSSVYSISAGRTLFGWTWCALLAALSLTVPWTAPLAVAAGGVFAAFAVVMFAQGGGARGGWGGALGFALFLAVTAGVGLPLERTVHRSEGAVMELLSDWMRDNLLPRGFGFEGQLGTPRQSRVEASDRALFEVEGDPAQRLRSVVLGELVDDRWHELSGEPGAAPESTGTASLTLTLIRELGRALPTPAGGVAEDAGAIARPGGIWSGRDLRGRPLSVRFSREERLALEPAPTADAVRVSEGLRRELEPFRAEVFGGQGTAREKASAAEAFFRDGFEYTLEVDLTGRGHPLAVLLRERRAAYCTYFASAMAILLRMEGIPARVVGGFAPSERNPLSGVVTVRERDAHAWVEVYLADEGRYVPFDPTPWRSRDTVLPRGSANLATAALDAVGAWVRRGFNAFRADPWGALQGVARSPLLWGAIVAGLVWRLRRRVRAPKRARARRALESEDRRLVALRADYLKLLSARADLRAGPAETDEELLIRLGQRHGAEVREHAEAFVRGYQQARFSGGGTLDAQRLRDALDALRECLGRRAA
ncbi:MAG: transglutaminase-like domain-containing protein [Myxococcota bacterium]|nr:transglutaminase-like domain-containing protein [Myxococcota bacterium]